MRLTITRSLAFTTMLLATATVAQAGWEQGVAAFKAGDLATAAKEFQAVVDDQPEWPGGHLMLGQVLLKMDRTSDAIGHLRKAYDLNPGDVSTQLALGKAYVQGRRYADAAALLGKIDRSGLPAAQRSVLDQLLAVAFDKSGQSDAALNALARAAQANPNDADLQFKYGALALNEGDIQTAVSALGKAAQLSNDPEKQKAYANALMQQGRRSRGSTKTTAYQKAAQAASKLVAADGSYDNLILLAGAQVGAKQYDGAISTCKRAVGKNGQDWLPHYYAGQAYTKKDQFRSAEAELKQAMDKARSSADQITVWGQLGFVYEKQKSYDQAIAAYNRAGNSAAVTRVQENKDTAQYNASVEEENRILEQMRAEEEALKEELQNLPGSEANDPPQR